SAAIRLIPGWSGSTRTRIRRPTISRMHGIATRPGARRRRWAACSAASPVRGDTIWANMAKAYEDLPDHVKQVIAPLKARHSIEASFGARLPEEQRHKLKAQYPDAEHPVVRTHPETGEKILFVN